ncbi:crinkler (CRN) family protein, putative [Phytophthora infestans T30-4]|uniref:Crinkler (CRN) family protein, putative n=1 Tax=Phytophthora infestans (strain T30-4) TaxID=403677 RepID=D0MR81_PHYIT|nr:crinkler (CRN) family protein, putative [Phytophthora infestans T30-4]EEY58000.1 crinkler (CRN) family protein, putative [Phytophthora infestans T30-4]|eukprot:XP_002909186.1 crinkler (CRN) family protein, putative [Phytophthora infestans T30-4]
MNIRCGVYGEGSVFSVDIDHNADVEALQEKIVSRYRVASNRVEVFPAVLTLYLARKADGTWLKDDRNVKKFLRGSISNDYKEMRPSWKLNKVGLFGPDFALGEEVIHVLVELPSSADILPNKRQHTGSVPRIEKVEDVPQIKIEGVQYVTLPAAFLEKCGYRVSDDLMLYCRREVLDLWGFVKNEVIAKNARGFIVGPPGTGKSVSTLSFVASLDRQEWNVVWIHLGYLSISCLALGIKKYWLIGDLTTFELPRVPGRKLLICVDGYKAVDEHKAFLRRIYVRLVEDERLLVCSSMATLGKFNREDAHAEDARVFFMYSWTQDDYLAAIADPTFYDKIASKLDATSPNEVNEDDGFEAEWSEEDKKQYALDLKFYYAGGSCRFMFQYPTIEVMGCLKTGVQSAANKSDLVKYCGGNLHADAINRLYGMQPDGDGNARFPVSSYAASLFAEECDEQTIVQLAARLNGSNNPAVDGHLFEWLFLASVPKRAVKLFGDHEVGDVLPQANVLRFDPKKRFKVLSDRQIKGDRSWLQPTAWNQGGYDAVHFDKDKGKVIFIQVTRSDKHDFKMRFFYEVLLKLDMARMKIKQVVIYFVVKPSQYLNFKMGHIEDRDVLLEFDKSWTRPEEKHVQVRAFEAPPL